MTILVGRHFHSRMLPFERASKTLGLDTFSLEIGDLTKTAVFGRAYPTPLRYSSMILVPREEENLPQKRFSYMLILFSMFLFDSGEGKEPNSPLYGQSFHKRTQRYELIMAVCMLFVVFRAV